MPDCVSRLIPGTYDARGEVAPTRPLALSQDMTIARMKFAPVYRPKEGLSRDGYQTQGDRIILSGAKTTLARWPTDPVRDYLPGVGIGVLGARVLSVPADYRGTP